MLDKCPESLMAYRAGLAGWSWFSNTHVFIHYPKGEGL